MLAVIPVIMSLVSYLTYIKKIDCYMNYNRVKHMEMSQIPRIHKLIQYIGLAHDDIEWYIQNMFISLYDFKFITHREINDIFRMLNNVGEVVEILYKGKSYRERSSKDWVIGYNREEYDPDIRCHTDVDGKCKVPSEIEVDGTEIYGIFINHKWSDKTILVGYRTITIRNMARPAIHHGLSNHCALKLRTAEYLVYDKYITIGVLISNYFMLKYAKFNNIYESYDNCDYENNDGNITIDLNFDYA